MAVYAIGDLQGCDREFALLLERLQFSDVDQLWLVGDLINRGPDSLAALRRVKSLGERCRIVLGNHDLHFLAAYFGKRAPTRSDTFDELLAAPDVDELAHWLRGQKLLHLDESLGFVMTHAGIPHIWGFDQAVALAQEVEQVLAGDHPEVSYVAFFEQMYGNEPNLWSDDLQGMTRLRLITNYLTRLRLVNEKGAMDFAHKGALEEAPKGWRPWFEHWPPVAKADPCIVFGHWAALDGHTGRDDIIGVDTGCVWGRQLTAYDLHSGERTAVEAI